MKTLRFLGMTLMMVLFAVNFSACSSDEDDSIDITTSNLMGKWYGTKCYGWEYNDNNQKENWTEDISEEFIWFESEKAGSYNYSGNQSDSFVYSLSGNKLVLTNLWDSKTSVTITKLTSSELHIKVVDSESEENYEFKKK